MGSNGLSVSSVQDDRRASAGCVLSDSGNIVFLFYDYRNQGAFGMYGQKFNSIGQKLWDSNDVLFTTQLVENGEITPDMNGGLIKVRARAPLYGVFTHQMNRDGQIGQVIAGVKNEGRYKTKTAALLQNYPNPFNPSTRIDFELPHDGHVNLTVYNIIGQKVKNLSNKYLARGSYQIIWDGRNEDGVPVASGLYIYSLQFDRSRVSKKMLLIR